MEKGKTLMPIKIRRPYTGGADKKAPDMPYAPEDFIKRHERKKKKKLNVSKVDLLGM